MKGPDVTRLEKALAKESGPAEPLMDLGQFKEVLKKTAGPDVTGAEVWADAVWASMFFHIPLASKMEDLIEAIKKGFPERTVALLKKALKDSGRPMVSLVKQHDFKAFVKQTDPAASAESEPGAEAWMDGVWVR